MYSILLTKRALKDLDKIDANSRIRIAERLKVLTADPFISSKKLTSSIIGTYRFRIGDFRVIFDLEDDKIIILRIGHRKDIYK